MSYLYNLEHLNILFLLTLYIYNNILNFLLSFIDERDLKYLLIKKYRSKLFIKNARFYIILSSLAFVLKALYNYKSNVLNTEIIRYYYNLKLKNVLVIKSHFIFSDFRLLKLKTNKDLKTLFKKN